MPQSKSSPDSKQSVLSEPLRAPDPGSLGAPQTASAPANEKSLTTLELIDRRVADADIDDAFGWLRIRGEVVKQDMFARDRDHLRKIERLNFLAKVGLSVVAIVAGTGLAYAGLGAPAFLCLGAGLWGLAPDFIKRVTDRFIGGGGGS